jgi:CheY-like chemotaxis protein
MADTTVTRADRVNILVVDDNADNRLTLESILAEPGQNVVTAASGRDALRCLLEREFAVILLDVNMPGIDGFETARLVRQRRSSERTPIIFITAFSDETHVSRGYSLGAVDYIVSPVVPEVLRSKVAVFVDLFRKTEQVRRQAESLRRRGDQLYHLTEASLAINSANSLDDILEIVTETARELLRARCALTTTNLEQAQRAARPLDIAGRRADEVERQRFTAQAAAVTAALEEGVERVVLVTPREVTGDPRWRFLDDRGRGGDPGPAPAAEHPCGDGAATDRGAGGGAAGGGAAADGARPDGAAGAGLAGAGAAGAAEAEALCWPVDSGWLAASLYGRDGRRFGWVHLTGRSQADGEFGEEDKAILTQLAQIASIAIENTLSMEAREANRLKDEFLTTLSHELRTPLTAILGWTRLLRTGAYDPVRHEHGLEVIERNVTAQARLIEDLLDVSRIIAGKLRVSLKPIPLLPSLEAAVEGMRPAAETKGIALRFTIGAGVDRGAALAADADRLQQVGWNLLSNAIKFTPSGGRIEVAITRQGGSYQLRVTDTGKGITPQFMRHVFDRFRQDDSSSTRAHGGLGIGLAIVQHIVELHSGRVEVESPGENQGATFTVLLPALAEAAAALARGEAERAAASLAGEGTAGSEGLAYLRVLLVDDEADTREIFGEILRTAGATVVHAASMAEALNLFDHVRPDLLISDIAMPGGDGYALIRQLRRRGPERGGWVPSIAVSAHARDEDRRRALAAGFERYVTKPVEPAGFLAAVREIAPPRRPEAASRAPGAGEAAPATPATMQTVLPLGAGAVAGSGAGSAGAAAGAASSAVGAEGSAAAAEVRPAAPAGAPASADERVTAATGAAAAGHSRNGRRRARGAAPGAVNVPAGGTAHVLASGEAAGSGEAVGEEAMRPVAIDAGSRRILLVEDDADSREALKTLLELSGHQVEVAIDGGAAVAHAIAHRPDVALVDIGLPEIDGNEVARRIRAELGDDGIFLVALTGYGGEADEQLARAAGFDAHFTKPVELSRLEQVLRSSNRNGQ